MTELDGSRDLVTGGAEMIGSALSMVDACGIERDEEFLTITDGVAVDPAILSASHELSDEGLERVDALHHVSQLAPV